MCPSHALPWATPPRPRAADASLPTTPPIPPNKAIAPSLPVSFPVSFLSSFIELSGAQLSSGCLCRPASAKKKHHSVFSISLPYFPRSALHSLPSVSFLLHLPLSLYLPSRPVCTHRRRHVHPQRTLVVVVQQRHYCFVELPNLQLAFFAPPVPQNFTLRVFFCACACLARHPRARTHSAASPPPASYMLWNADTCRRRRRRRLKRAARGSSGGAPAASADLRVISRQHNFNLSLSVCLGRRIMRRGGSVVARRALQKRRHEARPRLRALRASSDRRRIMAQLRFATSSHAASELHFLRCLYDTQRFRALTCATLRVGKPE